MLCSAGVYHYEELVTNGTRQVTNTWELAATTRSFEPARFTRRKLMRETALSYLLFEGVEIAVGASNIDNGARDHG